MAKNNSDRPKIHQPLIERLRREEEEESWISGEELLTDGSSDEEDSTKPSVSTNGKEISEVKVEDWRPKRERSVLIEKAIEKMYRLDALLALKEIEEKEAHNTTLALQASMESDFLALKEENEMSNEVLSNESKYLALNNGTTVALVDNDPQIPIFDTQPDVESNEEETKENVKDDVLKKNKPKMSQNFLLRNIQLVSNGGDMIYTKEEKDRLDNLLSDLDEMNDEGPPVQDSPYICADDIQKINDIDARLQVLKQGKIDENTSEVINNVLQSNSVVKLSCQVESELQNQLKAINSKILLQNRDLEPSTVSE